jgi:uncharacterized protein (TIGR00255 family)
MLESMTGFGMAICASANYRITVQIKSLNSKNLEFHFKLPSNYFQQEILLKNFLGQKIQRGKISFILNVEKIAQVEEVSPYFNHKTLKQYYKELSQLREELRSPIEIPITALLHLPQTSAELEIGVSAEEWELALNAAEKATEELIQARCKEGQILCQDILAHLEKIEGYLQAITPYEEGRMQNIKQRLRQGLAEISNSISYSEERLEQELIYYLEKWDINEEKIRIQAHLQNFRQTLDEIESQGRKLAFIMQELWREINTLGVKANEVHIQTLVVQMKDEVEKIKEQLMNVV